MTKGMHNVDRRHFIGGVDARIIMGKDEKALHRLWREKRGEGTPVDLSAVPIVQLGLFTEDLNRRRYELNLGRRVTDVRRHAVHKTIPWVVDMNASNSWAEFAALFRDTQGAHADHERAESEEDAKKAMSHGIQAKRSKSGAVSFDLVEMEVSHASVQ
jgi:predicted phage-related endonuclease